MAVCAHPLIIAGRGADTRDAAMFTGLIEDVGEVVGIEALAQGSRLTIRAEQAIEGLTLGESIAVDGVCLTALEVQKDRFSADISPETIARTNLSFYGIGTPVNLERSLAVGQRLGGHFVQGHVDGIARARDEVQEGEFLRMSFSIPPGLRPFLVEKGSVALNGVSLTVASLGENEFDVALVPHTLERTNLVTEGRAEVFNMEVDILGKYVAQLVAASLEGHAVPRADKPPSEIEIGGTIRLPGARDD